MTDKLMNRLQKAVTLHQQGDLKQAASIYKWVLKKQPDQVDALHLLGVIANQQGNYPEAITLIQRAITLLPDKAAFFYNLGISYQALFDYTRAKEAYSNAIRLQPNHAEAHDNLGVVFQRLGLLDKAIVEHRTAISLQPEDAVNPISHWNLSQALLPFGEFNEGWKEYNWGFGCGMREKREYAYPYWEGDDIRNKTLFITAEQGVGDEIMFASCFADAMASAKQCIIECDNRLAPLFERSFQGASILTHYRDNTPGSLDAYPHVDLQIPSGSLPGYFRNSIDDFPRQKNYLYADPDKITLWQQRFAELGDGLKIGISWRGGHDHATQTSRSTALANWSEVLQSQDVHFINLQYGDCSKEIQNISDTMNIQIHDWDDVDPLLDIDNFAAEIAALDLVISIDNSTVHLSGALGVETWLLLPYTPEWRWLQGHSDTPWYDSLLLLRQSDINNWEPVFADVKHRLEEKILQRKN